MTEEIETETGTIATVKGTEMTEKTKAGQQKDKKHPREMRGKTAKIRRGMVMQ